MKMQYVYDSGYGDAMDSAIKDIEQLTIERDRLAAENAALVAQLRDVQAKAEDSAKALRSREDLLVAAGNDWANSALKYQSEIRSLFWQVLWTCTACGKVKTVEDTAWRWTGEIWEHKCGDPQAGHFPGKLASVDFLSSLLAITTAVIKKQQESADQECPVCNTAFERHAEDCPVLTYLNNADLLE